MGETGARVAGKENEDGGEERREEKRKQGAEVFPQLLEEGRGSTQFMTDVPVVSLGRQSLGDKAVPVAFSAQPPLRSPEAILRTSPSARSLPQ